MFAAIGGATIAIAVVLILFLFSMPSRDYAIDVDPIKDSQNLFSTSRVTVANIGKLPVTNILVSYGGNDNKSSERIASLLPGEKVLLSPPESSPLKSVTVTADQGLVITKGYRTPIKVPGMMGS
ncbi:MAG TPA: hypothetical protein VE593_05330 [Nitrososphaeraceae archaeon]|jgi:hypothetical protein|nr:hypothetical protein [Nitrososphaeraceae archaeon]